MESTKWKILDNTTFYRYGKRATRVYNKFNGKKDETIGYFDIKDKIKLTEVKLAKTCKNKKQL